MSARYLIGIDPGMTTAGASLYNPKTKTYKEIFTGNCAEVFMRLHEWPYKESIFVIEMPNAAFGAKNMIKKAKGEAQDKAIGSAITMAFAMGKNAGYSQFLCKYFDMYNIPYLLVAPSARDRVFSERDGKGSMKHIAMLKRPTKACQGKFIQLTGCQLRTNEHGRDASTLVWEYSIKQVETAILIQKQQSEIKAQNKRDARKRKKA